MSDPVTSSNLMADITPDERPREKALTQGIKSLTDVELMALIFSTGIKGKGVMTMCREILDDNDGHLSRLTGLGTREFMRRYKGIGPAKALTFLAALELGNRAVADAVGEQTRRVTSSVDAARMMTPVLNGLDHEEFWVLMLRNNNTPLRRFRVGQGGMSATFVDVKILVREVLLGGASAVMIFHNHPSGNLSPSKQDIELTRRVAEALKYFDIRLLDHIIIANGIVPASGDSGFFSFHDKGIMP